MQRLEVSGVVRPIYGSLGVRRLIKRDFIGRFSKNSQNIKFHENPSSGNCVVPSGSTDRPTGAKSRSSQLCERA